MIKDLDETLRTLLLRDLHTVLDRGSVPEISFETPDDQFPPQSVHLPAIDLFLYDVRENQELRSNEVYVQRGSDGTAIKTRAPTRIDFSYLITAWPKPGVPDPAEVEHNLLGVVMQVLLTYPTIPENVLQGDLRTQEPALPVSALQAGRLQSLGEFWQALGGKPKAALNYQITLSIAAFQQEQVPLVSDKTIKLRMQNRGTIS